MQKVKASSEILAIVLLVLITIAVVLILYLAINNFDISLSPEFSCLEMQTNSLISIERVCYNSETHDVEITLRRKNNDFYIDNIDFVFDSEIVYSTDNCDGSEILEPFSFKTYYAGPEQKPVAVKVVVNSCELGEVGVGYC